MDAVKPAPSYGGRRDSLWYRAGRALKAIQDPIWFQQMRRLRKRGTMGGYGTEYDEGFGGYGDMGYEAEYGSDYEGGPYPGAGAYGAYGEAEDDITPSPKE